MKTLLMYNACLYKADEKKLPGGKKRYKVFSLKDIYFRAKGN